MRSAASRVTVWWIALGSLGCDRPQARPRARAATALQAPDACECDPARLDARPVVWGEARDGLRLGLAVEGTCVEVRIENTGPSPRAVFSHVYGGVRPDLEGYTLRLVDADGAATAVDLSGGSRRESGPIVETLAPGQRVRHVVNVAAGGCYPNMPTPTVLRGEYRVFGSYAPRCEPGWWCGHLAAGPATLRAP